MTLDCTSNAFKKGVLILILVFSFSFIFDFSFYFRNTEFIFKEVLNENNSRLIVLLSSWGCINDNSIVGRSFYNQIVNISDCFFTRIHLFSDNGGVIYLTEGTKQLSIVDTMFFGCFCSDDGGAIHSYSSNISIKFVCASHCRGISYRYHFAMLKSASHNHIEYLSMTKCSNITTGEESMRVQSGNQINKNTNSSMNSAAKWSCFDFNEPSSLQTTFCNFVQNNSSVYVSIESGGGYIDFCNIIGNNSPNGYGVVRSYIGDPYYRFCIFFFIIQILCFVVIVEQYVFFIVSFLIQVIWSLLLFKLPRIIH